MSTSGGVVGKLIFGGVLAVELFLVCFIAPAFTTGAISGERERQTFNLLRTTLLSARRIVVGKLISALAYIVLLLLVAVPLQSLAFLMGGITAAEVLLSVELLLVTGLAYGAVGIYFSARTTRTLTASILTYTIALLVTVALPIASLLLGLLTPLGLSNLGNPLLEAILVYVLNFLSATNPIAAAVATETALQRYNAPFFYSYTLVSGQNIPVVDPWVTFTVVYVLATIILVALAVRHVRRLEAA